ncbi:hypothetical protein BJ508DRAFT_342408 [Ascobolus immersus RN42]|uniref:Uncharacterized protein n=1 Tax=Ascobolus immersus RN42 TaxID=1160509 RepID=A0A3N4IQK1_ASCIM|nr:hypothetical protein BJ508DRAFT_342408 [Ascobolus immersus RN42]
MPSLSLPLQLTLIFLTLGLAPLLSNSIPAPIPKPYLFKGEVGPSSNETVKEDENYLISNAPLWPTDYDPLLDIEAASRPGTQHWTNFGGSNPHDLFIQQFSAALGYFSLPGVDEQRPSRRPGANGLPTRCLLHDERGDPNNIGPLGVERYAVQSDCMTLIHIELPKLVRKGYGAGFRQIGATGGKCLGVGYVPEPWSQVWDTIQGEGQKGVGWTKGEDWVEKGWGETVLAKWGKCRLRGYYYVARNESLNCFTVEEIHRASYWLMRQCGQTNALMNWDEEIGGVHRVGGRVYVQDERGGYKVIVVSE